MATVYLAIQESLDRSVALKILDAIDMDTSDDLTERFLAEGRIVASLDHPNIITIYDIGIADNTLYISMEYIQGGDLKQRLELSFSSDEALDYLNKIANALSEAHKRGIIHRDVKPANMLEFSDTVKLGDLGIVKWSDFDPAFTEGGTITRQSVQLGSWFYMAPEQQEAPHNAINVSDIYALGVSWIEMLAGTPPSPQAIGAKAYNLPHTKKGISEVISRMCSYNPNDRPSLREIHEIITAGYK